MRSSVDLCSRARYHDHGIDAGEGRMMSFHLHMYGGVVERPVGGGKGMVQPIDESRMSPSLPQVMMKREYHDHEPSRLRRSRAFTQTSMYTRSRCCFCATTTTSTHSARHTAWNMGAVSKVPARHVLRHSSRRGFALFITIIIEAALMHCIQYSDSPIVPKLSPESLPYTMYPCRP